MNLSPVKEIFGQEDLTWLASAHGTQSAKSVTLDVTKFTAGTHYPAGYIKSGQSLGLITATGLYGPYDPDTNEVQSVTITGTPTGGTFTLTWDSQTTAAIAYNATAATVQTALAALSNIGAGNIAVTGSAGGPYSVTFQGTLFGTNVDQMTATASLTGGTSPGVTIATTTAGGAAGASNGQQTLVGFLLTATEVTNRDGSFATKVSGPLVDHCMVHNAKLPFPVDAAGIAEVAGRIIFR